MADKVGIGQYPRNLKAILLQPHINGHHFMHIEGTVNMKCSFLGLPNCLIVEIVNSVYMPGKYLGKLNRYP
jgi:hypothetical protein